MDELDSDGMKPAGRDPSTRAAAAVARDAALARVGNTRRWVILGSAGLSAGFAALVAASPPSHASATKTRAKATTTTTTAAAGAQTTAPGKAPALPPLPSGSQLGLAGPDQNPGADDGSGGGSQDNSSQSQAPSQSAPAPAPAPSPQPGPVSGGS